MHMHQLLDRKMSASNGILKKILLTVVIVAGTCISCSQKTSEVPVENSRFRIALFNIWEMSTEKLSEVDDNGTGQNEQLIAAAEIIKEINPDILVINEIDHDIEALASGADLSLNLQRFQNAYLRSNSYKYMYVSPCNTGFLAGKDFDNNGKVATEEDLGSRDHGGDCFGYGAYPGQYSMAILSRIPIETERARTFQKFLWKDLPDHKIPTEWYSEDEIDIFRLSSKSHWDVPVRVGDNLIHLLVSHPTPPVFDGDEDRNGRRNYDELKMWVHYIEGDSVLVDDAGIRGGLAADEKFLILGDLNASPTGDTLWTGKRSIDQLLGHPLVIDCADLLRSDGALNNRPVGPPKYVENWTTGRGKWGMRIDHIIPSVNLEPLRGGVHWPDAASDSVGAARVQKASDHRLIWMDIKVD